MMYFCFKEEGAGCCFPFLCHVLCYKCEIVSFIFRAEFTVICVSLRVLLVITVTVSLMILLYGTWFYLCIGCVCATSTTKMVL